jgi:tetratricopeptide (TPR) repeat protein
VVTAISPSAGDFNWAEVIWHELAHVHHLQLSNSRVPRWFTEGLAEFEAGSARSEWRREQDLELLSALREGRLLSVGELNHGFTHARSLVDIVNAYFQSALVIEFIESRWGFEAILAMLKLYGSGQETGPALKQATGLDVAAFDLEFRRHLEARYARILKSFEPSLTDSPEALLELAARRPRDAGAQGRAALSLLWARRLDEAEAGARRAIQLDPKEPNALYLMAFLEFRAGEVEEARAKLEGMVAGGQDGYSVRLQLGALEERRGRPEEALRHYEAASGFYPRGVEPWRAVARLSQGDQGRLIEALWQVTELDQSDFEAALRLARLERGRGELSAARRAAVRALQIRPFAGEAQRLAGELALEEGDGASAARALRLSLRLWRGGDPSEKASVWLTLARALQSRGDKAGAKSALEEARALAPGHPELGAVQALLR